MIRELRAECERLGIAVGKASQSKHHKIELTNAHGLRLNLVMSATASDKRAWLNTRSFIRRFAAQTKPNERSVL